MDPFGAVARWQSRLVSKPGFQRWASRFPLTRRMARKDGEKLFDLVAGFVYSQTLYACVELEILSKLSDAPMSSQALALKCGLDPKKMDALCNAATSIGLLARRKDGRFALARLGAAALGVPGLTDMIRHHDILYRDMADPVALLREDVETELAAFWPYVLGQGAQAADAGVVSRYSDLMAQSQAIVADETLRYVNLANSKTLMDVGGGTGAFVREVQKAHPELNLIVFDLPDVVSGVDHFDVIGGSFLDPLPQTADTISLIRVLYDHADVTIDRLLENVFAALPQGGHLIISEPMSGGDTPVRATDAYFSFYTMAMRTGQVRSQGEIAAKLGHIGFDRIQTPKSFRPYVTSVVLARKPDLKSTV